MENASNALLMAAGILIGILILTLMITLFASSKQLSNGYGQRKEEEAIQQFNVNFMKYLGQDLTIHQVITITSFAKENKVTVTGGKKVEDIDDISEDLDKKYRLEIESYDENTGYINKINITNN